MPPQREGAPYYLFIPRVVREGWTQTRFFQWAREQPGIWTERESAMRTKWHALSGHQQYRGAIAGLPDEYLVSKSYTSPPMYPGRTKEYTYVVGFRYREHEGGPWIHEEVSVISDTQLRKGQVLDWAGGFIIEGGDSFVLGAETTNILVAEWRGHPQA